MTFRYFKCDTIYKSAYNLHKREEVCNCMLWKHIVFVCMPVCLHLFVLWVREPCLSLLARSFSFSYIRANGSMPGRNMLRTRHGAGERSLHGSVRLLARCPLVWITLSFVHLKCYKVWTHCHCGMTWLTLTIIPLPLSLSLCPKL